MACRFLRDLSHAMPLRATSPWHIYRQRSGSIFGFESVSGKSVFWGVLVIAAVFFGLLNNNCCIFKCLKFSTVFLGLDLVTRYFTVNTVLHSYHIMLNFCKMNCGLRQYFGGFAFHKAVPWVFSVAKYFLGHTEVPCCTDSCL